jgi:hypothetical protein
VENDLDQGAPVAALLLVLLLVVALFIIGFFVRGVGGARWYRW